MRKIIMSVLLASVAASPVMALDRTDRQAAREEREQQREERQKARQEQQQQQQQQQEQQARERVRERPAMERQRPAVDAQQVEQFRQRRGGDAPVANDQAPMRRPGADRVRPGQQVDRAQDRRDYREELRERRDARNPATAPGVQADRVRQDARGRVDARRQEWDQRRAERIARQQEIRNQRPPVVSPTPRPGTQPPPPPPSTRPSTYPSYNWSSNHWRNDRRYNWYDHRNRYWWLFQLGWYNDPFGWGYQPYNIGWRMWPSYYSSNYWLDDPWQYRLPYAPAGTRWIRYWDDAILVDLWSGQVVDVIYNFFW